MDEKDIKDAPAAEAPAAVELPREVATEVAAPDTAPCVSCGKELAFTRPSGVAGGFMQDTCPTCYPTKQTARETGS